tara:strand:- start:11000 stop:11308 length:309 start_codon:yes stop_codon:yes gene_type:complete
MPQEKENRFTKRNERGALWTRKAKRSNFVFDSGYLSLTREEIQEYQEDFFNNPRLDAVKVPIVVLSNKFKEDGSKEPDFRIFKDTFPQKEDKTKDNKGESII